MKKITVLALGLLVGAASTADVEAQKARAELMDADGKVAGMAHLTQTAEGVHIQVRLDHAPPGSHAFHIHEIGACAPDFSAAGGHYAPEGDSHGMLHGADDHAGDMLNLHVDEGEAPIVAERVATEVTLREGAENSLFDADGSAIVVHAGPDDYASQPSGAAGARIMCGVIEH